MNTDEISNLIVEKTKAIIQAQDTLNLVQVEQHNTKKRLLDLSESVREAKHIISKMRAEKEILERQYWASK